MSRRIAAERVVEELRHLPMRRESAGQLLSMLDDPAVGAAELAAVAEQDPSLTARLLQMANSANLGLATSVVSVVDAITVLGLSVVRSVAMTAAAGLFEGGRASLPDSFWSHSTQVAAAASVMGEHLGHSPGECFSAGLVHDVGQALLYRMDPMRYKRLLKSIDGEGDELLDAERSAYGMTHQDVGAVALARWKLPAKMIEAVRYHHLPVDADTDPLRAAVAVGDKLSQLLDGTASEAEVRSSLDALGLGELTVDDVLDQVRDKLGTLSGFESSL